MKRRCSIMVAWFFLLTAIGAEPVQTVKDIVEVIFQTFTYGGIPTVNTALKVLREVLIEKGQWPVVGE